MQFKIICFNLWANSYLAKERLKWVLDFINREHPDILLLVEVTNEIVLDLVQFLRIAGYFFKVSNESRTVYEIVCSRWQITNSKFSKYSTTTSDRGMLWAEIQLQETIVCIAAAQLDSSPAPFSRQLGQFDCILKFLNSRKTVILYCDTQVIDDPINDQLMRGVRHSLM